MWWAGKRGPRAERGMASVYVGQDEIRLMHGTEQQVVARAMPPSQALPLLREAIKPLGQTRPRLRVLVSGAWCQPFLLPAVEGVSGEAEWLRVAQGLLTDLTGLPGNSRLWLDKDKAQGLPPLAVALHPEVDEVVKTLAEIGMVRELRPWWALVLEDHADTVQAKAPAPARGTGTDAHGDSAAAASSNDAVAESQKGLAIVDTDAVTLLMADGDRYEVAQSYVLMGEPAQSVLARALISQGRHVGEVVVKRMIEASPAGTAAPSAPTTPAPAGTAPFLEVSP